MTDNNTKVTKLDNPNERSWQDKCFLGLLYLAVIAVLEVIFFRSVIFTDALMGDMCDARWNNFIVEHWYQVLCGKESLSQVCFFYPDTNQLSYSDMLLGFAPLYCLLRIIGLNIFAANEFSVIGLHFVGSVSLFYLLHYKLRINPTLSFTGLAISSFAYNYAIRLGQSHTQMVAFSFIPLLAICIISYLEQIILSTKFATPFASPFEGIRPFSKPFSNRNRFLMGLCAVILIELTLYSSFYVFFFTALFGSITFVCLCCTLYNNRMLLRKTIIVLRNFWRKHTAEILILLSVLLILTIPYIALYLPSLGKYSRSWSEVSTRLLRPQDFFYFTTHNLIYGPIMEKVQLLPKYNLVTSYEHLTGYPLVTLVLFIAALAALFTGKFKEYINLRLVGYPPVLKKLCESLFIATGISLVISVILVICQNGISLWWFIYKFFPGGGAIRMAGRYLQYLSVAVAVVNCLYLDYAVNYKSKLGKTSKKIVTVALFVFIFLENQLSFGIASSWNTTTEQAFLDAVPPPPVQCKAMFIVDTPKSFPDNIVWVPSTDEQLDSWAIALKYNLKTLNGYSANYPINWYLRDVNRKGYINDVIIWAQDRKIDTSSLYAYSVNGKKWIPYKELAKNRAVYSFDDPKFQCLGKCFMLESQLFDHNALYFQKDSGLFGPGVDLLEGQYEITVTGSNINGCIINILHKNSNGMPVALKAKLKSSDSESAIFVLDLTQDTEKVMISLYNKGEEPVLFYNLSIESMD